MRHISNQEGTKSILLVENGECIEDTTLHDRLPPPTRTSSVTRNKKMNQHVRSQYDNKKFEHTYIYIQVSPSGCVLREIPGVTQVEKGHAGNTAVATAYLCWVKHGQRSSRTGVPADYYY